MNPKRIAIVIAQPGFSFSNPNSAVANYLKAIGGMLSDAGHQVDLFPNAAQGKGGSVANSNDLLKRIKGLIKKVTPAWAFHLRFRQYFSETEQLNRYLGGVVSGYDIVIEFCVYGSQLSGNTGDDKKPFHFLIFDAPQELQFREIHGRVGKFASQLIRAETNSLRNADMVICYSEAMRTYLRQTLHLTQRIEIIPCIVWKRKVEPRAHEGINIGFIGSFLTWHRVELLVSAFEKVAAQFPQSNLYLVGYGEEWEKIRALVDLSAYANRIHMTGFVTEKELEDIKSLIDIGVMPGSNWYGSPLKLFEYAESGIALIAPSTPTVLQYFKHRQNALIIDPVNELESLSSHLISLIQESVLRRQLAEAGLKMMATDFAKENVFGKFVMLVQEI